MNEGAAIPKKATLEIEDRINNILDSIAKLKDVTSHMEKMSSTIAGAIPKAESGEKEKDGSNSLHDKLVSIRNSIESCIGRIEGEINRI